MYNLLRNLIICLEMPWKNTLWKYLLGLDCLGLGKEYTCEVPADDVEKGDQKRHQNIDRVVARRPDRKDGDPETHQYENQKRDDRHETYGNGPY